MNQSLALHIILSATSVICMFFNAAWSSGIATLQIIILLSDLSKGRLSGTTAILCLASLIASYSISELQMNFWQSLISRKDIKIVKSRNPKKFIQENSGIIPWYARGALVIYKKDEESDAIGYIIEFPVSRSQINFEKETITGIE